MDQLDFAILNQLQEDGRKPFTEIAKSLGVTEGTVRNRFAKLTADKTVQVIGLVDPHRAGFDAPALISVSVHPGLLEAAVDEISQFPEISYLLLVTGEYDLVVEVMCRDRAHLTELLTNRIHKVNGVQNTYTTPILRIYDIAQPDLNLVRPAEEENE